MGTKLSRTGNQVALIIAIAKRFVKFLIYYLALTNRLKQNGRKSGHFYTVSVVVKD